VSPLRIWRLDDKFPRKTGPRNVVFLRGMYFFMQKMFSLFKLKRSQCDSGVKRVSMNISNIKLGPACMGVLSSCCDTKRCCQLGKGGQCSWA
jgi:hypothetical protein